MNLIPHRFVLTAWRVCLLGLVTALGVVAQPAHAGDDAVDPRLGIPFARRARPTLGSDQAPVVVIEVSSFKCGRCRLFHERVFRQLRTRYIATGKVQWVLLSGSFEAKDAAARVFAVGCCARQQGKFWDVADALFALGEKPPEELDRFLADHAGLDRAALAGCEADAATRAEIAANFAEVQRLHLRVTPTFFVRKYLADGRQVEAVLEGYQDAEFFGRVIEAMLAKP